MFKGLVMLCLGAFISSCALLPKPGCQAYVQGKLGVLVAEGWQPIDAGLMSATAEYVVLVKAALPGEPPLAEVWAFRFETDPADPTDEWLKAEGFEFVTSCKWDGPQPAPAETGSVWQLRLPAPGAESADGRGAL